MYAVLRSYSGEGASQVFDLIEKLDDEVKTLIQGVPGFVSYTALRSGDGGVTMTVCDDKAGADESSRRASEFVKDKSTVTGAPPTITEGNTLLQF